MNAATKAPQKQWRVGQKVRAINDVYEDDAKTVLRGKAGEIGIVDHVDTAHDDQDSEVGTNPTVFWELGGTIVGDQEIEAVD